MDALIVLIVWILLIAFVITVGGWCIEYTLEYWLSRNKAQAVDVSYFLCCGAALFVGWNIGIPAAIITKIHSSVSDAQPVPAQ